MITPNTDPDVRRLNRKVAELVQLANALSNMTVIVDGQIRMIGKLEIRGGSSYLHINSNTEVGSLGT